MQPSEMVMNPKQVFLSVLIFGVAGLLFFMYLQVWIEEQHTGWGPVNYLRPVPRIMTTEKIQEHITYQNPKFYMPEDLKGKKENLLNSGRFTTVLTKMRHLQRGDAALSKTTGSPTSKLIEKHQGERTLFKKFSKMNWPLDIRPLNNSTLKKYVSLILF
ncbi:carbohydrate sulfotransferase 9 [Tupaia chinensis]|uniref:carbohydrate sulfotransferase 9 n=1 Tax=Tupaia chinensis TaxID=246437 RepID=UPI000FFBB3A9|nr:carbohydrate sulfotransferase 9 [Tupaia chinensis]